MDAPAGRRPTVFARHAASLLLWRNGAVGTEVLMGMRGAGHRFVPNRLVFPGGAVDESDRTAPAAAEPDPATLEQLGRNARPKLARALAMAAARELEEETGLSLGHPPRLDTMRYLCRAVTPPDLPIRFNARFLVAPAADATGKPADTRELQQVRFYQVDEALELDLMLVTREVLLRLQAFLEGGAEGLWVFQRHRWVTE